MTRDEIIERMGWPLNANSAISDLVDRVEAVVRKAEEAEREACAKLCDERASKAPMGSDEQCEAEDCAYAIRARGEP